MDMSPFYVTSAFIMAFLMVIFVILWLREREEGEDAKKLLNRYAEKTGSEISDFDERFKSIVWPYLRLKGVMGWRFGEVVRTPLREAELYVFYYRWGHHGLTLNYGFLILDEKIHVSSMIKVGLYQFKFIEEYQDLANQVALKSFIKENLDALEKNKVSIYVDNGKMLLKTYNKKLKTQELEELIELTKRLQGMIRTG